MTPDELRRMMNRASKPRTSIHLQGIGEFRAKPAHEFKVGKRIVYNYGSVYTVKGIKPSGKSSLLFTEEHEGKIYTTRKRRTTLLGWHL